MEMDLICYADSFCPRDVEARVLRWEAHGARATSYRPHEEDACGWKMEMNLYMIDLNLVMRTLVQ